MLTYRSFRFLCAVFVAVAAATLASAQKVRWEPAGGSLALRQTSDLSLIFEDCEPDGAFDLPNVPALNFGSPNRGEQSSFQIINGEASRRKTVYYTYPVRPSERARIVIPAFTVKTDKGPARVESVSFEVGDATVGGSAVPLENAANSEVHVGSGGQMWAGEVVPLTYTLSVASRFPAQIAGPPTWDPSPLAHEEWAQPEPLNAVVNGESRSSVLYRTRGYIHQPGTYTLKSIEQLINLRVPSAGFSVFQQFQAEQYTITSNQAQVVVRPLPGNAPTTFNGAVGDFKLTSQIVPEKPTVGEPVTWTLTLTGTGNWPDIPGLPARQVSKDFRVVQPQAKRTPVEGKLFEATLTEDVVLIPTKTGSYTLGPVDWSYFDPKSGTYKTVTTAPVTITVDPTTNVPPKAVNNNGPQTFGIPDPNADSVTEPTIRATPAPASPSRMLRDPVATGTPVTSPWSPRRLIAGVIAVLALILPFWLLLAFRRAWSGDAGRAARAARRRLAQTLAALPQARERDDQIKKVIAWQRDSAVFWESRQALPPVSAFAAVPEWQKLWREADAFLYRADGELPSGWTDRAQAALRARRAPRFPIFSMLRLRNVIPAIAIGLFVLSVSPSDLSAAETKSTTPEAAYAAGDFAVAAEAWQAQVAQHPTDWAAHHNLSLALAQQKKWSQAAAHATVAFVQNPAAEATRWSFGYTLDRAGFTPPFLGAFVQPDWRHQLAQLHSPSTWQRLGLAAAALLTLALGLSLWRGYNNGPRFIVWISRPLGLLALLVGVAVGLALPLYGPAQHRDAVLVNQATQLRSIPTDVAAEQETTTLAAGSLARIDGTFLGWRRLSFPNGQTGWVRVGELTPIWDAK